MPILCRYAGTPILTTRGLLTHLVVLVVDRVPRKVLLHDELLDYYVVDGGDRLLIVLQEIGLGG